MIFSISIGLDILASLTAKYKWPRIVLVALATLADIAAATYLLINLGAVNEAGKIVALVTIAGVAAYRLFNRARLLRMRSSVGRIGRSTLRASLWLGAAQIGAFGLVYLNSWQLALGSTAFSALAATLALYHGLIYRTPPIKDHLTDRELPSVSILIPARNETQQLISCLESVVAVDYPKLEVLVLDDCSTNKKTPQIIKGFARKGVRFIAGGPPREDWIGKNNAYEELRAQASSDWLFFMGADVRLDKQALRNLMSRVAQTELKMVSVLPLKDPKSRAGVAVPLRYWWEYVLPRELIDRPPVLSTAWLAHKTVFKPFGGFSGVSRSVMPERHFARSLGANYAFWVAKPRSLWVSTTKPAEDQRKTALRHRYPQHRRRVERVALTTAMFGVFMLGVFLAPVQPVIAFINFALLFATLYVPSRSHMGLAGVVRALLVVPMLVYEAVLLNVSMYLYEFADVSWRGRNVCLPVMRVYEKLPRI